MRDKRVVDWRGEDRRGAARLIEEEPRHHGDIRRAVVAAFGRDDEAALVDSLRESGALALSLVAVAGSDAPDVIGHIALSRLHAPGGALALAPVAVVPAAQGRGIGSALVRGAIARASSLAGPGVGSIFVLGNPDYYRRFGFSADAAAAFPCRYAGPGFMALHLAACPVPGPVIYPAAFDRFA